MSVVAFVVCVVVAAGILVRVPYYAFSPGSVRPTASLITIEGPDVHPPDGEVMLMTVSISRQRLTLFAALRGWLDPTVTVVDEEDLLGGGDREATRQVNLQLMDNSKEIATYVALDRLGYEVGVEGTGSIISQVSDATPADGVLVRGDTIVSVDGEPVDLASDLIEAISSLEPGTSVALGVEPLDSDDVDEREVVLGARDDDPDAAFLGVVPQTRDGRFVFPFEIEIDTGGVGGPSAGLSFTLTILDLLTEGELTGGIEVAATGTIGADGVVGPIGGVEQKAAAARRDGVKVFLVPGSIAANELDAARRQAGDEVQIIEVNTLDEALEALVDIGGDPLPSVPPGEGSRS
ncbi:MAG: PDZ domain-containing protein [Acidimicrobiia bacterium]|nr:PDZ domain-containing protein [Acidimicrobiia bacterium]